jgi:hypothetical protein
MSPVAAERASADSAPAPELEDPPAVVLEAPPAAVLEDPPAAPPPAGAAELDELDEEPQPAAATTVIRTHASEYF